jgi:ribose transport system substrate-binding protein
MRKALLVLGVLCLLVSPLFAGGKTEAPKGKYKIFYSMSVVGNEWQTINKNLLEALAKSDRYKDRVEYETQVAGEDAQKQVQQIKAMVMAGADAIIVYPVDATALEQALKAAAEAKVVVYMLDTDREEKYAYSIAGGPFSDAGRIRMEYVAKQMGYKGNLVRITGIPGTLFNTEVESGVEEVLAKYPDIKVIATANGEWTNAGARARMKEILVTHPWDEIDGIVTQYGADAVTQMQLEDGRPADKLIPIAGETPNLQRLMMLPPGTCKEAVGLRSISVGFATFQGALALKLAVDILDGKSVPKLTLIPLSSFTVTSENVKLGDGSLESLRNGANCFPSDIYPDSYNTDIYHPDVDLGLDAALGKY